MAWPGAYEPIGTKGLSKQQTTVQPAAGTVSAKHRCEDNERAVDGEINWMVRR